jgi:2',3'-cyclic-nucleotide 2'-phosphodiesterase
VGEGQGEGKLIYNRYYGNKKPVMRILILGDVVGRPGRRAVQELVPALVKQEQIDLAIANAENAAGGMGVDIKSAGELFGAGVHVLTSGNHIWKKKEIYPYL